MQPSYLKLHVVYWKDYPRLQWYFLSKERVYYKERLDKK